MEFIPKHKILSNKKETYANIVCDIQTKKDEVYRTSLIVGGDNLDYYGDTLLPAPSLIETKLLINSMIYDAKKGASFYIRYQRPIPSKSAFRIIIHANTW